MTETERILDEYRRREAEIPAERYAPWHPAEMLMRAERKRLAAQMLRQAGVFPAAQSPCLEVGYGKLGWLGELITWGVAETSLSGIELDATRVASARRSLPAADLRLGDAARLDWEETSFALVVASTIFTSVLERGVREQMAAEITRVLRPGGALLWYDFRFDNPSNSQVRGVRRRELKALFPKLGGEIRSLTLAPPIARRIAPRSHTVAVVLSALPFLRTHLMAVLKK